MPTPIIILLVISGLLGAFIAFIVVRTLMFVPEKKTVSRISPVAVNGEKAAHDLAEMLKCKTVSSVNKDEENPDEFEKFEALLPKLFPNVFANCTYEKVGDRSLLFKWPGALHDSPTVLMSHYDVVSVVEENWEKPPFSGEIEHGVLWGRGALDTKGTLNGVLQAAETLMSDGFIPARDIYFAFGGNEEINGDGALNIVNIFHSRGISPGLVLDEGGAVVENVFPGVKLPCALIGIAEKGMLDVEYSVTGGGGHSSSPAPHTPVGKLAKACVRVENHPFKFRVTKPAKEMFNTVARHSTFFYRMIFANLWCFSPVLNLITRLSGGEMNAMMRTTTAFTQMEGSKGVNVIPPFARIMSNHRLLPGETTDEALERIRKTVKDKNVSVRMMEGHNPSNVSSTDCEAWERVKTAASETWQDAIISPYLMFACSDSRHWSTISDRVYRFSAMALTKEERGTIHGNNERVPLATINKTVEFYIRLIKMS